MSAEVNVVVDADWLNSELKRDADQICVLDVTWYSDKDAYSEYTQCHIPGALHFDIMKDVEHNTLYPRNIPKEADFQKQVQLCGINNKTLVILYDNTTRGGVFIAARAWWMFKYFGHHHVSVLNGGLRMWSDKGFPVTSVAVQTPKLGDFTVSVRSELRTTFEDIICNIKSKEFQICDTRAVHGYVGTQNDLKTGHIPGAVSIPFDVELLTEAGHLLKSPTQLLQVFQKKGIDIKRPIVSMCNSGMSSCSLVLAAKYAGSKHAALYHGGFTEWKNRADPDQIVQGEL